MDLKLPPPAAAAGTKISNGGAILDESLATTSLPSLYYCSKNIHIIIQYDNTHSDTICLKLFKPKIL